MITKKLDKEKVKPCDLVDFCSDMHLMGEETCKGLKNYKECPSYMHIQGNSKVYNGLNSLIG